MAVAVVTLTQQGAGDKYLLLQRPKEGLLAGGDYILEPCTLLCLRVVEAVATSCRHAAVTPWRHVSMRVLTLLAAHALQACGNSLQ